jgi:hypothetical protein
MAKAKSTAVAHCCPRCAKLFTGRRKTGRWCSWRCYDADHSQAQICDHCGKTFGRRQLRRHQGVFCSPACYYAHPHRPLPPRRTLSLSEKVWPKVEQRGHGECWPWHGARNKNGQGHLLRGGRGSRFVSCSRAIYEITHGEVPAGFDVCHTCDQPSCCNPDHLFAAPHRDNMLDMARKQRSPGRRLTAEQVTQIRQLFSAGGITKTQIGKAFGVSRVQIANIVSGQQWTWLCFNSTPPS